MKIYMDFDTGETYTEKELRKAFEDVFEDFRNDYGETPFRSFEDYIEKMLTLGRERKGGFLKVE